MRGEQAPDFRVRLRRQRLVGRKQAAAALGVQEPVVLQVVLLENDAHLAPAVAVALQNVLKQAVVEAVGPALLLLRRRAAEGLAQRQRIVGQTGDPHAGFLIVALGGIERRQDLLERAVDLHLALDQELLQHRRGPAGLPGLAHGLFLQTRQQLARQTDRAGELVQARRVAADQGRDVGLQRRETAGRQALGILQQARPEGALAGDGKQRKLLPVALLRELAHVVGDDLHLLGRAQVALLQDEDDVAHPVLVHLVEKLPGRGAPGIHGAEHEDHQVGNRHEPLGDLLVLTFNRVGAGRVDDVKIAEELARHLHLDQRPGQRHRLRRRTVLEKQDLLRRRHHAGLREVVAEQRVEEGRLADVHLADDDEHKRLLEAGEQIVGDGLRLAVAAQVADGFGQGLQFRAQARAELEVFVANHQAGSGGVRDSAAAAVRATAVPAGHSHKPPRRQARTPADSGPPGLTAAAAPDRGRRRAGPDGRPCPRACWPSRG